MIRQIAIAFGIFIALAVSTDNLFGQARLDIDETSFDFGMIPQVCKVSHSYVMRSTGTDSLRILSVKPGCGCTKAPTYKEVVAPGDSTAVELIFTSIASYRGTAQKTATVTCNDDARGTFMIRFKATFNTNPDSAQPMMLDPWTVEFTNTNRSTEIPISVKNVSQEALKLTMIDYPRGLFSVRLPAEPIRPGASAKMFVKLDQSFGGADFEKSFTFAANTASDAPRYTVPVVFGKPTASTENH